MTRSKPYILNKRYNELEKTINVIKRKNINKLDQGVIWKENPQKANKTEETGVVGAYRNDNAHAENLY